MAIGERSGAAYLRDHERTHFPAQRFSLRPVPYTDEQGRMIVFVDERGHAVPLEQWEALAQQDDGSARNE